MTRKVILFYSIFFTLNVSCSKISVLSPKLVEIVYLEEFSNDGLYVGNDLVALQDSFTPSKLRFSVPLDSANFEGVQLRSAFISWNGEIGGIQKFEFQLFVDGLVAAHASVDVTASKENIPLIQPDGPVSIPLSLEQMLLENASVPISLELISDNSFEDFSVNLDLKIQYAVIMSSCQEMPPGVDLRPCQL